MQKKTVLLSIMLVGASLIFSGCNQIISDSGITYVSCATKISYTISYGYFFNCSGEGLITIDYDCDRPEVLVGTPIEKEIFNLDYNESTIGSNEMYSWNFIDVNCSDYKLGLSADVVAESYVVSDLTGANALDIKDITPALVEQYCQAQGNDTITYIDPKNPVIVSRAQAIYNNAGTNNSFLVALEAFKWLKTATSYTTENGANAKPAATTIDVCTGDCDDLSYLYISLCKALDIPARFIRGFLVEEDHAIAHAWVEVYVGGGIGINGWIPVECAGTATGENKITSEVNQNFGLESANHLRLFKDDGSNLSLVTSLQGITFGADPNINAEDISAHAFATVSNYQEIISDELHVEDGVRSYQYFPCG